MKNLPTLKPNHVLAKNERVTLFFEMGESAPDRIVSDVRLEEGSSLDLIIVQDGRAEQSSELRFTLGPHARLNSIFFTHGESVAKNEIFVDFAGEGAAASLRGLSLLRGKGSAHHAITANHRVGGGTSDQFYKSILTDMSRSDFDSLVYVHKGASKSDSRQLNKNLLLSEGARGYARPQLKILNDDVACKHGATTGQLEKNELFYLLSRGLSKEQARFVLIDGFAEEVFDTLPGEPAKRQLKALVRHELEELIKG